MKEETVKRGEAHQPKREQRLLAVDDSRPYGARASLSILRPRKEMDMGKPMDERICPILKGQCIKEGCRFWIDVGGYEE